MSDAGVAMTTILILVVQPLLQSGCSWFVQMVTCCYEAKIKQSFPVGGYNGHENCGIVLLSVNVTIMNELWPDRL